MSREEVKKLEIAQKANNCLWRVDTENWANSVEVTVKPGCVALYYSDGAFEKRCNSGKHTINVAYGFLGRQKHDVTLIAANTGEVFAHAWGVGDIPYRDRKNNLETRVGMHGSFKFSVTSPETLYQALGGVECVTPDTIANYSREKLKEFAAGVLCEKLQNYDYFSLTGELTDISDMVQEKFSDILFGVGVMLKEFSSTPIFFPEEYVKAREEKLRAKEAADAEHDQMMIDNANKKRAEREEEEKKKKEREEEEYRAKMKREADAAEAENLAKILGALSGTKAQVKTEEKCSVCGATRSNGDTYCFKCGHKF